MIFIVSVNLKLDKYNKNKTKIYVNNQTREKINPVLLIKIV